MLHGLNRTRRDALELFDFLPAQQANTVPNANFKVNALVLLLIAEKAQAGPIHEPDLAPAKPGLVLRRGQMLIASIAAHNIESL
jgi:hypothetical protein